METVKKFYLAERINPSTKLPIFFINEMGVKTPAKQFNDFWVDLMNLLIQQKIINLLLQYIFIKMICIKDIYHMKK